MQFIIFVGFKMFALVDCNSCYAACEQIFRPDLRGKPVVVLSNNDGCIVARNSEAKALGIPDLEPYFKLKPLLKKLGVQVFSSNYALYGDISARVMNTLRDYAPDVEVYSIDEMFLQLDGMHQDMKDYGLRIKNRLWQDIRMPVCVGIAPSKTLAKLANHGAKKIPQTQGVCVLDTPKKWQWLQQRLPVNKVWGIGARTYKRLTAEGIYTVADLANSPAAMMGKRYNINMERTIRELNGEPCIALMDNPPSKQNIYCTRSFGHKVHNLLELQQAACLYAARAAQKLRAQSSLANTLHIFIQTSRHQTPYYANATVRQLPYPTNDSRQIQALVRDAIASLYRPDYAYAKAGVGIIDLQDGHHQQGDFFHHGQHPKAMALMQCMDQLNVRFGRHSSYLASQGNQSASPNWAMQQNLRSPAYTTRWGDIPTVHC